MKAIIIFFDSLNRHFLPNYGNDWVNAPNFKRLDEKTLTFDRSYVGSMPCMPARRELHTGRHNFLHREWGPLEPFDDSMPEILKKAGVYTHMITDHFHYWEDGGATFHNRFSSYEMIRGQEGDHWKGEAEYKEDKEFLSIPEPHSGSGKVSSLWRYDRINRKYMDTEEKQPQSKVFSLGCEFIEKNSSYNNWLLHIETFDPHEPFFVKDKYLEQYKDTYSGPEFDWPRGEVKESPEAVEHIRKKYAALVSMCDKNLGMILDLMDKHNMWEDTMLIVGTDHGFLLGEHGWWGKNLMPYYNEIANTPLFIWDPRSKKKNERRNAIVQMIDWAPTLLDYFDVAIPETMKGKSLKETIETDVPVREECIYGVHGGHVNMYDGNYTYMRAPAFKENKPLYNYTLMPMHMNKLFSVDEIKDAELSEPVNYSKNVPVLKFRAEDKYKIYKYGTLIFDINNDPKQLYPVKDKALEQSLTEKLIKNMEFHESPKDQYTRLGLNMPKEKKNV